MADLANCLQTAIDAGEVDPGRARAAQEKYRDLVQRYSAGGTPEALARQLAADDVMEAITANTQRRRHTVLAQMRDLAEAQRQFAGIARDNPDALLRALEMTEFERVNLEQRFMSRISEFLAHNRTRVTGQLRDKAMVEDVARELHGQATGNVSAREFAAAIEDVQEYARQLFNMNGGDIGRLQNRGVAHAHNPAKIRAAGFKGWFDTLWNGRLIDWHRIEDFSTGKPFVAEAGARPNRAAAERFLREVYEGIASDGWARREPSMQMGGAALYNRRKEHRVLHFVDGDAWLRYNEQFGQANPFDAIVGELRGMARDISLMRNFGPNPRLGVEFRAQIMAKDASGAAGDATVRQLTGQRPLREVIARKNQKAQVMLRHLTGEANQPADGMAAAFFAGARNVLTAAQLGSATLVQVSDIVTMRMAAKAAGLNPTGPWQNAARLMSDNMTRQQARDLGYIFDTWFHTGAAQARMIGDIWSPEWTNRLTNFVLRTNGLAFLTDRSRTALRYTFALELGEMSARGFDQLPPPLADFLRNRGLSASDWDHLRDPAAMYRLPTGGMAISPTWFAEHSGLPRAEAEAIAGRLARAIENFTELGVPTASLRGRATLLGDARPGSLPGELMRSTATYRSFVLSVMFNQMNRVAELRANTRAQYVAALIAQMTLTGVLAVQMKELARGRDPRPLDDWRTWGAGALQGGGIGIFGDFISATTSRAGGGLAETAAGPVVGAASDLGRAVVSNARRVAEGRDPLIGRDAVNMGRRYNPLATHWAVRTALDRLVWDQLQDVLDPEARQQWRRLERAAQRDFGTQSYWRRGQMLPDRGPDFGNMVGGQQR